jgi:GT2 family glycosyltransferase
MFLRASAFRNVHGFDASFFAHMEEIDLCWRMQLVGGKVWYCPASKVYHVGGGTLHKSNPRKTYLNFRNNLLMLYKNLPENEFKKVFIFRLVFDFLAAIKFFLSTGGIPEMKAVLRAHKDFRDMKKSLKTVQIENGSVAENISKVVYPKSILREYYLSGRKLFSRLNF